jgi:3-methyl-2-oxobutanoate hydroxymethyltransferase
MTPIESDKSASRVEAFRRLKQDRRPIVVVTAFDFASANAAEIAGVDAILVGDSAATTSLGYESTRRVTLEEMLSITAAVRRGAPETLLIGDLPFGTYEHSNAQALETARRFLGVGCDAVKMEGAGEIALRAAGLVGCDIAVMGHVGLQPQQLRAGDAPRVEAKSATAALDLLSSAKELEAAGCFAIVFEAVPAQVTQRLVPLLSVPTIGIGAGSATDGQVLVSYDLLGLSQGHVPRFVKRYAELRQGMIDAFARFGDEVRARHFPTERHTYGITDAEVDALDTMLPRWERSEAQRRVQALGPDQ